MNSEIRKAMQLPEYKGLLAKLGMQAADGTPEEFDAFVRDQIHDTVELIKYLGIKPIED
jgi:tripartite-type tricarboxylate transporter receptor subunit TctC